MERTTLEVDWIPKHVRSENVSPRVDSIPR